MCVSDPATLPAPPRERSPRSLVDVDVEDEFGTEAEGEELLLKLDFVSKSVLVREVSPGEFVSSLTVRSRYEIDAYRSTVENDSGQEG